MSAENELGPLAALAGTWEGSDPVHGILSNPYLDEVVRGVHYELTVRIGEDGRLSYEEDTVLELAGQTEPFHHTDHNRLAKVG